MKVAKYYEYLNFIHQAILSQVLGFAYSKRESEEPAGFTKILQARAGLENFV